MFAEVFELAWLRLAPAEEEAGKTRASGQAAIGTI